MEHASPCSVARTWRNNGRGFPRHTDYPRKDHSIKTPVPLRYHIHVWRQRCKFLSTNADAGLHSPDNSERRIVCRVPLVFVEKSGTHLCDDVDRCGVLACRKHPVAELKFVSTYASLVDGLCTLHNFVRTYRTHEVFTRF